MAFSSSGSSAGGRPPQGQIGPFTLGAVVSLLLLSGIWLGWDPATNAYRTWRAGKAAAGVRAAIDSEDWPGAYRQLAEARRKDADSQEVITATIEFLTATNSDPGGLVQQYALLEKHRPLTEEERLVLGRALIATGKIAEARTVHDKLPAEISGRPAGLQLLSEILAAEGRVIEARQVGDRATAGGMVANEPEAVLRQSMKDRQSSFPEVREQARSRLWEMAEGGGTQAVQAISTLAGDAALTKLELNKLLALVESNGAASLAVRLDVVASMARLDPQRAPEIFQAEVARFLKDGGGRLDEFAAWLMRQRQDALVFELVPVKLALTSRELYPVLMQSMSQAGRWKELRELLMLPNPPVPRSLVDLALADVQAKLEPDLRESRRLLEGTVKAAVVEGNHATLRLAAELAAKLNLQDLAALAYLRAGMKAAEDAQPELAVRTLQKALEAALINKDTAILLEASRLLGKLTPGSSLYADRLDYLRLVLGVEMETVQLRHDGALPRSSDGIPPALLQALAAYRLGDLESVKAQLGTLATPTSLPAGQRAVAAGLLALAGKPDRAWQIAEKVPDALLLNEEKAFLKHAR